MSEGMVFCRACGAPLHSSAPLCPTCGVPQADAMHAGGDGIKRSFGNSIAICFRKYLVFNGRAPRAEFWYFSLFQALAGGSAGILAALAHVHGASGLNVVSGIVDLALFCPGLSVYIRRFHDLDRSGWWYWLCLVPIVGWIILLVWMCTRGTRGENTYGAENGLA